MFFASDRWFHTFFASGSAIFCSQKMQPTSYLWQLGWLFCLHFNTFHSWLVVSNMFYCPFHIWDVILPIDSYFSSWLKPPTRESHVLDPGPGLNSQFVFSHPQKWDPKNGRSLPPGSVLRPAVASALDALLKRYAQVQHGTKAPPYLPHKLVLSKLSHPVLLDLWVRELHEAHGSNSQSVCERASRASCAQGCREYIVLLPRKQILWLDKIVCFSMARDGDFFHPPNEHRPK